MRAFVTGGAGFIGSSSGDRCEREGPARLPRLLGDYFSFSLTILNGAVPMSLASSFPASAREISNS